MGYFVSVVRLRESLPLFQAGKRLLGKGTFSQFRGMCVCVFFFSFCKLTLFFIFFFFLELKFEYTNAFQFFYLVPLEEIGMSYVLFLVSLGKFIIWAAATMLIQAERKEVSAGPTTLPLAERMAVKVLQEKVRLEPLEGSHLGNRFPSICFWDTFSENMSI